LLYTKILEGLQQKLEGLEPLSPIAGAATDNIPDYVENTLLSTTHWTIQFHGAVVGCSLRAPWSGVANSQTDRHRAKVTVGA